MSGSEPDWFARAIAIFATLVALASLGLAWLNYRRGGARVKVDLRRSEYVTFVEGVVKWPILEISVRNVGHAPVQITGLWFEVEGDDSLVGQDPSSGPDLPFRLDGNSQGQWGPRLSSIAAAALGRGRARVKVRAVIQLAGLSERHSKWLDLTTEDSPK